MNDMRRTILWVVFSVSLVLLWDAWNKNNGNPSMFSPRPVVVATGPTPGTASVAVPAPAAAGTVAIGGTPAAPPIAGAAALVDSEKVVISTDVVQATFDSKGGDLIRLELLKYSDAVDAKQHVLLFDHSPKRVYLAQTGLVSNQAGISLPNHLTLMKVLPGDRTLRDGDRDLSIVFESPEVGGNNAKWRVSNHAMERV